MALIDEIQTARSSLGTASGNIAGLQLLVAQAEAALEVARRTGVGIPAAENDLTTARTNLQTGRTDVQEKKAELRTKLEVWVPETFDATSEIARLESQYALVLFPVRIETRFALAQSTLKIRVYPDDIYGSTHEKGLTAAEHAAGARFKASTKTLQDWQTLLQGRTPQRAAYIRDQLDEGALPGKADSWTRPVEADLLPDRWIAIGYRPDGTTVTAWSKKPVEEPLRLSFDPSSETADDVGGLPIDPELKWTVDFDAALAAGMGLELPADSGGFDRLLVFGVKGSMLPLASVGALYDLLREHRYSRGVAVVKQGTPTNNTAGRDAGYPPDDQGGQVSFEVEKGGLAPADSDGDHLRRAFGVPESTFGDVAGGTGREQKDARNMNTALWPVSFGHFLQHMMDPVHVTLPILFSKDAIEAARIHFADFVRGRGPFPAFRVGAVPYGVLPVSSLELWQAKASASSGVDIDLPPKLKLLRGLWLRKALEGARRVGQNPNEPDDDLLRIIGLHPSARQMRVRPLVGDTFQKTLFDLLRRRWGPWTEALAEFARRSFELIGQGAWNVRVGRATHGELAFPVRYPLVAPEPLSEELDVEGKPVAVHDPEFDQMLNYIDWLRMASIDDLKNHTAQPTPRPQALLYYVLRHSLLTEYARLAYAALGTSAEEAVRRVLELIKIIFGGGPEQLTIWEQFNKPFAGTTLGQHVQGALSQAYRDSFKRLAELSQAEVERLFSETLDVASHRLDAWITSLFTKRLKEQRDAVFSKHPKGSISLSYLGAFAWVEDLKPGPINRQSGGFVHAPSTAHAAAAAVLRSGFVTRKPEAAGRFAFDLTSKRVRVARGLLEAVRGGQPAGAVLGYRFERALHDGNRDRLIDPIRKLYPLVANKAGLSSDPAESVAARNVVDGLALRLGWQSRPSDDAFFATISISPALTAAEKTALAEALNALDEAVDGVADLLTAESVYQMVRGNAPGSAAPLDALAGGAQPPDPEVARTPRGGTAATHRVGWLWAATDPVPRGPWAGTTAAPIDTRRSDAEPVLDDWVGSLLGSPEKALCWIVVKDGSQTRRVAVTFKDLEIRPLDVLELASESPDTAQDLERRILHAGVEKKGVVLADLIEIDFDPAPTDSSWDRTKTRTFPEVLELARQVGALLGHSRPARSVDFRSLDGADIQLSGDEAAEHGLAHDVFVNIFELEVMVQLDNAISSGAAVNLRPALREAAEYALGAFPDPRDSDAALLTRAKLTRAELRRRQELGNAVIGAAGGGGTPETGLALYRAMFGRTFMRLARFTLDPAAKQELDQSATGLAVTQERSGKFLRQNARVRAPLASWRKLWLHAEAVGAKPPTVDVAQLPFLTDEVWAGDDGVPVAPRLSLVLARSDATRPDITQMAVGLVIDEWTEIIPNAEEQTGIAFNYDNPGAEAAQSILIAVPPDPAQANWRLTDLTAILNETLDLAKVRAVEPELIGETRQVLPALYLTANVADEAISTDFSDLVRGEAVRVPRQV